MTKPYPAIEEVEKRIGMVSWGGKWGRIKPEDIIRHICDLDRERREAPAEERIDLPPGWVASCKSSESC